MVDRSHSAGVVGPTGAWRERNCTQTHGRWTSTPAHGKGFRRSHGRLHHRTKKRLSTCCVSAAVRTCSPTQWPRRCGCQHRGVSHAERGQQAQQAGGERDVFPRQDAGCRFRHQADQSAICAVMLYDAKLSQSHAARMLEEGIYVTILPLSGGAQR